MRFTAVLLGAALALSGCSSMGSKRSSEPEQDGPALAQVAPEEIHSVEPELPPLEEAAEPREARRAASVPGDGVSGIGEASRTAGHDPRAGGSTSAARKAAPAPSLNRADPNVPMAPMAGRVGIMSLLDNDMRHVHSGTFGSQERRFNVQYDFNGYVMDELRKALLTKTPYQPVPVAATGALRRAAHTWHKSWDGKRFTDSTLQREFDGILKQNRLAMLIIVSYPSLEDGQFLSGAKLTGSGLYTRRFMGSTKAAVFSTLQFYRLVGEPAKLVEPVAPAGERSIGDLPNANLPDDLDDMPPRYLVPVYEPLRTIVQNKIHGLVSLPRKLGH